MPRLDDLFRGAKAGDQESLGELITELEELERFRIATVVARVLGIGGKRVTEQDIQDGTTTLADKIRSTFVGQFNEVPSLISAIDMYRDIFESLVWAAMIDRVRAQPAIGVSVVSTQEIADERDMSSSIIDRVHLDEVRRSLPPVDQQIIEMVIDEGMSVREIAIRMGISRRAVRQVLISILRKLTE